MEIADGGDLLKKVESLKKKGSRFQPADIWKMCIQMLRGIKALHDIKVCHRDLKCANVFLTKNGQIKMGDLNVSKYNKAGLMKTQTGTPYYAAPEVWSDKPYTFSCDIWSLGCVFYELITLQPPFQAKDMRGLCNKVIAGKYPPIPTKYGDMKKVIAKMLITTYKKRATANELLEMPELQFQFSETLDKKSGGDFANKCGKLLATIKLPR